MHRPLPLKLLLELGVLDVRLGRLDFIHLELGIFPRRCAFDVAVVATCCHSAHQNSEQHPGICCNQPRGTLVASA